jgi:hypothetical protein
MIMKIRRGTVLAAALGVMLIVMGGCAPDSGFNNIADYDVVVTHYAPDADFQKYTTFVVADTLLLLGDPDGDEDELPSGLKDVITSEVETQMLRMGYVLENDPDTNEPDLVMLAGVTSTDWTGYVPGYPVYPGYPWYGYPWYPGYPWYGYGYTYSYTTGTVIVDMFDYATLDEDSGDIDVIWTFGMNGILSSSSSSNYSRIQSGIVQGFEQSPYLKQNATP